MLIDEIDVLFEGGHGGRGLVSFGDRPHAGPDGGNGGKGGDLYVKAASEITLLNQFKQEAEHKAQDGFPGGKDLMTGKGGKDMEILLPIGTVILDMDTNEEWLLDHVGQTILLCKGGLGGRGNYEFRSSRRTTPKFAQPGEYGQRRRLRLNLNLIADYGLVGLPNSGKSSLLNELSNARAKVGNWAFTTLSPNLGSLNGKIIADIPGLIEGASQGRGLGFRFLKHIKKVGLILHCVAADSQDLEKDFFVVEKELKDYGQGLLKKKRIIILTKTDLVNEDKIEQLKETMKKFKKKIITVSIYDPESIDKLKEILV